MKILIISDFHFSKKFDEKQFKFYTDLFNSVDQVIINGDLWEGLGPYKLSFDDFVNSKWSELFPVLKSKDTVYIFGNHDKFDIKPENYPNDKVKLFSNLQVDEYKFNLGSKKYHIIHGSQYHKISTLHRFTDNVKILETTLYFLSKHLSYFNFGTWIYKTLGNSWNKQIQNYQKLHLKEDEILICGDTHSPYYSESYINTGFNFSRNYGYAVITEDDVQLFTGRIT